LMANGGFEAAPTGAQIAFGWRGAGAVPATVSTDARTGSKAGAMGVPAPGFAGSVLLQNSVDDGGRPSILGLYVGKTTTLTFWAKGSAGATGDLGFSLRYLDSVGNILAQLFNVSFVGQVNPNTWTRLSYTGPALPANTSAIFLEMTLATGPIGVASQVLIDDVSVTVLP
jgi:hypothetical protein